MANAANGAEHGAKCVVVNGDATCEVERRTFSDGEAVRYWLPDGVLVKRVRYAEQNSAELAE